MFSTQETSCALSGQQASIELCADRNVWGLLLERIPSAFDLFAAATEVLAIEIPVFVNRPKKRCSSGLPHAWVIEEEGPERLLTENRVSSLDDETLAAMLWTIGVEASSIVDSSIVSSHYPKAASDIRIFITPTLAAFVDDDVLSNATNCECEHDIRAALSFTGICVDPRTLPHGRSRLQAQCRHVVEISAKSAGLLVPMAGLRARLI